MSGFNVSRDEVVRMCNESIDALRTKVGKNVELEREMVTDILDNILACPADTIYLDFYHFSLLREGL